MSDGPALRSIGEIAPLVRNGTISPVDLVRECLARIDARPELNAFITVFREAAIDEAGAAGRAIRAGNYRGPLHGIPVSLKDLVDMAGTETTSGSRVPPRRPAADAPIVTRLREAGAIIIGKTNLHEFAFGTTCDESGFGPVRHPRDPQRSPGGSSGGAAVALVEGMCFGSIGTDTGGSIRIPSAACGTVGLKPTFGELSCEGIVPLSTSFDHVGPMARSVADTGTMFAALKGEPASQSAPGPQGRMVFGVPEAYFCERLDPAVRRALERTRRALAAAGHEVRAVQIRHAEWTPQVYLLTMLPEASQYHAPSLESHPEAYSPGVRLRLEMGRYVLAEDYVRAQRLRAVLRRNVEDALKGLDALLLPTMPVTAPPLGATTVEVDGRAEPVRSITLKLTQLFNMSGHPAIAMPAGEADDGFPVSLQLVGHINATERLLDVAAAVEAYIAAGPGSVGGGTG